MVFSKKKSMEGNNHEGRQLKCLSKDEPVIRGKSSCLSQIYYDQWEKSNMEIEENKSEHHGNGNSNLKLKNLSQDEPTVLQSFSAYSAKIDKKQKENKHNGKNLHDEKFCELIAKNKELSESLEHSRRRTRELVKELREERLTKRIRKEDFNIIQTILNRYL